TEFDKKSLSYFTRERFDFFYPSYGSSYPAVMGSIGMLTEQGGIGGHLKIETEDGYVLEYRQRVYDHYTTCVAQIKAAARNRRALIDYSLEAWDPMNSKSPATAYVIENDGSEFFNDMVQMLLLNKVIVERTLEDVSAVSTGFRDGKSRRHTFPKGSLIVGTEQPRHLFVNSILSQDLEIEDSVMYDMSTWSAPLAYNLEAYSVNDPLQVATEIVEWEAPQGRVVDNGSAGKPYAYVIPWNQRQAPKALAKLWQHGYRVRCAHAPITTTDGTEFPAGSLIVLVGRNLEQEEMAEDMAAIAVACTLDIHQIATGRMAQGHDLASPQHFPVKAPKVALMVEPPFNVYTSGQLYFLFDWETELPVDRIRASILDQTAIPKFGTRYGTADLNDYDVLILPDANNLNTLFDRKGQNKLKQWIMGGGTVIAIGQSASFFTGKGGILKEQEMTQADPKLDEETAKTLAYADRTEFYGKQRIPGAALNATIDTTHPLAFGVKKEVFSLNFGPRALEPARNLQSVARYVDDAGALLAAGYASDANLETLAGKTWAGVRELGAGKIVYFMDNPHYRMFWRGPSRMMQNAVM
ncbi:MAG: peptidase M14, partial [Bacteroidota bacterium]